ncbi:DUF3556 domain-containing protein [Williamsia muralis]|nr:DUF3556 domain-containing protein [Williamsia muralis]
MTGGILYWARPKTIRLAPWPGKVAFTSGDSRTLIDVVLYFALILSLSGALVLPGANNESPDAAVGSDNQGFVSPGDLVHCDRTPDHRRSS